MVHFNFDDLAKKVHMENGFILLGIKNYEFSLAICLSVIKHARIRIANLNILTKALRCWSLSSTN